MLEGKFEISDLGFGAHILRSSKYSKFNPEEYRERKNKDKNKTKRKRKL